MALRLIRLAKFLALRSFSSAGPFGCLMTVTIPAPGEEPGNVDPAEPKGAENIRKGRGLLDGPGDDAAESSDGDREAG